MKPLWFECVRSCMNRSRLKTLRIQIISSLILSVRTFQRLKENFEQNYLNLIINSKLKFSITKHFALKMLLLVLTEKKLFLSFVDKQSLKEHSHFWDKKKVRWKWLKSSWVKGKIKWKKRLKKCVEVLSKSKNRQIKESEHSKRKKLRLRSSMSWCVIEWKSLKTWFKQLNKRQKSASIMKSSNVNS